MSIIKELLTNEHGDINFSLIQPVNKNIDKKCLFYKQNTCLEHCNISEVHLWECVNNPDDNRWKCDRESELFHYSDDTGQTEFINETSKVYFAHATQDYNTEYEMMCIEKIKDIYPEYEIINPRDIKIPNEDKEKLQGIYRNFIVKMEKYFFPIIDTCNILIVSKNKYGKLYGGVQKEIEHAQKNEIRIEYLNVLYPEPNRETINCDVCSKQILKEDILFCGEDEYEHRRYGCEKCAGV